MTKKRDKNIDRRRTAALLLDVANGEMKGSIAKNWLGHTGGAEEIDFLLLCGATMERMRLCREAVDEHLRHLHIEHGLTVEEVIGVYRLAVLPAQQ